MEEVHREEVGLNNFFANFRQHEYPEELHMPLLFNDEVNPEESREAEPEQPCRN